MSGRTTAGKRYLAGVRDLLERLQTDGDGAIEATARLAADCIARDGLVHFFGSGHSMLPALELFPRYGSFVGLHPVIDPRLFWFNVVGSFGVPEMLFLQNTEGYAPVMLDGQHLRPGDVMMIFSHSGTSAVVVDAATVAKEKGLAVVAVSSSYAADTAARHSSGMKLTELADIVIDTGAPRREGLVDIPGLEEPVGAVSTVLAMAAGLAMVSRTAELLVEADVDVVQSVRAEEGEVAAYRSVYDAYEKSLRRP